MRQLDQAPKRKRDDRGAGLIEYCLLIALIALVCVSALLFFGGKNSTGFNKSANCIVTAGSASYTC